MKWAQKGAPAAQKSRAPAPALAQAANEAVLYGSAGDGSSLARSLVPMVDPAERLSTACAPDMQRGADLRCHSIIIDDLMMFKTVATRDLQQPTGARQACGASEQPLGPRAAPFCQRHLFLAFGLKRGRGGIRLSSFLCGAQKLYKELPHEANYDSYAALKLTATYFHSIQVEKTRSNELRSSRKPASQSIRAQRRVLQTAPRRKNGKGALSHPPLRSGSLSD